MKNLRKRFAVLLVTALVAGSFAACGTKDQTTVGSNNKEIITIGIGQFAEHGSLDNCREGFLEGLKQEGYVEGDNLKVLYDNAQADVTTGNQIIDNFISKKVDLICGIATPMAQSAYSGTKKSDIPVIFTAVTDPILAELAKEDGTPVGLSLIHI